MSQPVNVNDNEIVSLKPNYNFNNNDIKDKYAKSRKAETIADDLLAALNLPDKSRPFMCKVALRLAEARIWDNVEQAKKGDNPAGLFIYLCKRDGV